MAALCGATGTCLGTWIKVFSVDPNLFYVSFIGQSVVAASQVNRKKLYIKNTMFLIFEPKQKITSDVSSVKGVINLTFRL